MSIETNSSDCTGGWQYHVKERHCNGLELEKMISEFGRPPEPQNSGCIASLYLQIKEKRRVEILLTMSRFEKPTRGGVVDQ